MINMEGRTARLVLMFVACAIWGQTEGIAFPSNNSLYGHEADQGEFPWQVALFNYGPDQDTFLCGGAIISPSWILTTAHCCNRSETLRVYSGAISKSRPANVHEVERVTFHPDYSPSSSGLLNNIALIKLKYDIEPHLLASPIILSETPISNSTPGELAGWGYDRYEGNEFPDRLRVSSMNVIDTEGCRSLITSLPEDNFCATNPGTGTCFGDEGSTFVIQGVLSGLVGFYSDYCTLNNFPSSFVDVYYHRNWIRFVTGIKKY
ncbi:thrombin-like enzyme elegaxobin-1 [Cloeon dipterum]|uniref:thrombin-like enzyme elegaxobin-1 n=1 Tax=Cloeon dipterum TaxID=197152 RepID=UPI00321F8B12